MPSYAICSNLSCPHALKSANQPSSGRAIDVPECCPSCGSKLVFECWHCGGPIFTLPLLGQIARCELCRVDLRQRVAAGGAG
jgi:hypothetical protein